jgi:hypothetical protein
VSNVQRNEISPAPSTLSPAYIPIRFNPKDRALAELEEIADQNGLRVNRRTLHMRGAGKKHGWCISPNIERAKPAREKQVAALTPPCAAPSTKESAHAVPVSFPAEMMSVPIVSFYNPSNSAAGKWRNFSASAGSATATTSIVGNTAGTTGMTIYNTQVAGDSAAAYIAVHYVAAACPGNAGAGTGC